MKLGVSLKGGKAVHERLAAMSEAAEAHLTQALTVCALRIQRTAKKSIQSSPPDADTGRSKPGNPPRTDTGKLVNSIYVDVVGRSGRPAVEVGTDLQYGAFLEFGTTTMAARPWLQPAKEVNQLRNIQTIREAVKTAMQDPKSRPSGAG